MTCDGTTVAVHGDRAGDRPCRRLAGDRRGPIPTTCASRSRPRGRPAGPARQRRSRWEPHHEHHRHGATAVDTSPRPSPPEPVRSATRRLLTAELRLLARDPLTLTFVLAFPIVTMLIIGGSFGTEPDEAFPVNPAHWYVASYFTVVIGATGLIMLPVHIASYRERGVLRRFAAAGFPRWSFAFAATRHGTGRDRGRRCAAAGGRGAGLRHAGGRAIRCAWRPVSSSARSRFVSIGVLLGTVLPSARSAQAVGLLLFFPSFLLGVGGPPPGVMSRRCGEIAEELPLALANRRSASPGSAWATATGALVAVSGHRRRRDDARRAAGSALSHGLPSCPCSSVARGVAAPAALALFVVIGVSAINRRRRGRVAAASSRSVAVIAWRGLTGWQLAPRLAVAAAGAVRDLPRHPVERGLVRDLRHRRLGRAFGAPAGAGGRAGRGDGTGFVVEWSVSTDDAGWGAWIAGTALRHVACTFARRQRDARATSCARPRPDWPNGSAPRSATGSPREMHDVIGARDDRLAAAREQRPAGPRGGSRRGRPRSPRPSAWPAQSLDEVRARRRADAAGAGPRDACRCRVRGRRHRAWSTRSAGPAAAWSSTWRVTSTPLGATPGWPSTAIVQEALTNAARHGDGTPVSILSTSTRDRTIVTVDSGGSSARPAAAGRRWLVAWRAGQALGGGCSRVRRPGGWRVEAVLPRDAEGPPPARASYPGAVGGRPGTHPGRTARHPAGAVRFRDRR